MKVYKCLPTVAASSEGIMTAIDCITLGKHCVGEGRLHTHERNSGPATRRQDNPKNVMLLLQQQKRTATTVFYLTSSVYHRVNCISGQRAGACLYLFGCCSPKSDRACLRRSSRRRGFACRNGSRASFACRKASRHRRARCGSGRINVRPRTPFPILRSSASSWSSRNPKRGEASVVGSFDCGSRVNELPVGLFDRLHKSTNVGLLAVQLGLVHGDPSCRQVLTARRQARHGDT